jgi:hypothetical protein
LAAAAAATAGGACVRALAVRPPAPLARPADGSWLVGPVLILGILFLLGLIL